MKGAEGRKVKCKGGQDRRASPRGRGRIPERAGGFSPSGAAEARTPSSRILPRPAAEPCRFGISGPLRVTFVAEFAATGRPVTRERPARRLRCDWGEAHTWHPECVPEAARRSTSAKELVVRPRTPLLLLGAALILASPMTGCSK